MSELLPNQTIEEFEVNDAHEQITFEDIFGLSEQKIEELLTNYRFYDFYLGQADSDDSDFEKQVEKVISSIDKCLDLLELEGDKLVESFIEDANDCNTIKQSEIENVILHKKSVGELYYNRAYMSLDIEGDDYGGTTLGSISFKLDDNKILSLEVTGDFWTDRIYKHPINGQPFQSFHDEDIYQLSDAVGHEIELLDSEVNFSMTFMGRLENID